MNIVRIDREKLLDTVRKNRDAHRRIFEEALEGYRKRAITELDGMLSDARNGLKIRRYIGLIEPSDQTKEYDRVIRMLEMSSDGIVELSETDFAQYVMDDWAWKSQFLQSTANYLSNAL